VTRRHVIPLLAAGAFLAAVAGTATARQATRVGHKPAKAAKSATSPRLLSTEIDPVHTVEPAADAPLTLSEADLAGGAQEREASLRATLVAAHYVPYFGGTAELVVEPDDPASFVQTIGRTATALLGP
jgi:hypothetical protein